MKIILNFFFQNIKTAFELLQDILEVIEVKTRTTNGFNDTTTTDDNDEEEEDEEIREDIYSNNETLVDNENEEDLKHQEL